MLVSQPFDRLPSQSAKGKVQDVGHIPKGHPVRHSAPHSPQLFGSALGLASQPFDGSRSQSAKPMLHAAMTQVPLTHIMVALGALQAFPQLPQLFASLCMLVSQPFDGLPSQSAKAALHVAMTHWELTQAGVALGREHIAPQLPQFNTSVTT